MMCDIPSTKDSLTQHVGVRQVKMTTEKLSEYRKLLVRLDSAEEMLASLLERSDAKAITYEHGPKAPQASAAFRSKDGYAETLIIIEDLQNSIAYLKRVIKREKKKLQAFIDSISSERIRVAVRFKYQLGMTWAQTAEVIGKPDDEDGVKMSVYRYLSLDN